MSKINTGLKFQLIHNTSCYNSYIEKQAQRANEEIVSEELNKIKTDIKHINNPDEKLVSAEAEKFFLLFMKVY